MTDSTNSLIEKIKDQPFTEDCLSRKDFVVNISNILTNSLGNTVYSLEASFGAGKTVLNHRIMAHINKDFEKSHQCIYLNAWESDFYENPFIPIIDTIYKEIFNNLDMKSKIAKDLKLHMETLKEEAIKFGKKGIYNFSKALMIASNPILAPAIVVTEKVTKDVKSKTKKKKEKENQVFLDYQSLLNAKIKFIDTLKNISKHKKIIIILDELDRCRPDYAIQMLETIKHFFSVDGITFLLSINKEQLANSVKCIYGLENDSEHNCFDDYLRKFVDFSLKLPEPNEKDFITYMYRKSEVKNLVDSGDIRYRIFATEKKLFIDNWNRQYVVSLNFEDALIGILFDLLKTSSFKLRQIEQFFNKIEIFIKTFSNFECFIPEFHIPLLYFHENDLKAYNSIKNGIQGNAIPSLKISYRQKYSPFVNTNDELKEFIVSKELISYYKHLVNKVDPNSDFININDQIRNNKVCQPIKEADIAVPVNEMPKISEINEDFKKVFDKVEFVEKITN
jgi:hypothetical protein